MTEITVSLPAPHAAQRQIIAESKRFSVLACGRRWGKTTLGIDRLVEPTLNGFPCAWLAPSYKSLSESWREIQNALQPVVDGRNNAEHRLELAGGGSVTMWSLDGQDTSDLARGRAYKCVVVDEAAIVPGLLDIWERVIRPMLADYRGDAWFLSTPRGMNDFKTLYDRGQDPEREDWASWCMPTASNPFIDPAEIEAARRDMTAAAFGQEFMAEFQSWEGAVFRKILEAAILAPQAGPQRLTSDEFVIGCDWGKMRDYTVFVVYNRTKRAAVYAERSNKVDYQVQADRLAQLSSIWRPTSILTEMNSIGTPIFESLQRRGLPVRGFTTTNQSKARIIEALALSFEKQEIKIINDPVLIAELQAFAAVPLPSGMTRYEAPAGGHDDFVMALALAYEAARRGSYGFMRDPLCWAIG